MNEEYKEVNFKKYCETCKHKNVNEVMGPCYECLEHPTNLYSSKPVGWEEKE